MIKRADCPKQLVFIFVEPHPFVKGVKGCQEKCLLPERSLALHYVNLAGRFIDGSRENAMQMF